MLVIILYIFIGVVWALSIVPYMWYSKGITETCELIFWIITAVCYWPIHMVLHRTEIMSHKIK